MEGIMQTGSYIDMGMFMQSVFAGCGRLWPDNPPSGSISAISQCCEKHLSLPKNAIIPSGMTLGYEDTQAQVNQFRTAREAVENFHSILR
jgi:hypothetical protein